MPLNDDATNQILPFAPEAVEAAGDLMSLAEYAAAAMRLRGHQPGLALRELENRALRQATHMGAGLAQFIANRFPPGVKDDADLDRVEEGLWVAILDMILENGADLSSLVPKTRRINTLPPLKGGGTLSADLEISISSAPKSEWLLESGTFTASVSGLYSVTVIGGGGGGGKGSGTSGSALWSGGGKAGGTSSFGEVSADGGGGGAGSYSAGAGGGGGPGRITRVDLWLDEGQEVSCIIGAGGTGGTALYNSYSAANCNGGGGTGGLTGIYSGGSGAAGASPGLPRTGTSANHGGAGGAGGITGYAYGNGGGGGGGGSGDSNGAGGRGGPGAASGGAGGGAAGGGNGGTGAAGAIFIEWEE